MANPQHPEVKKKLYTKPQVTEVRLVAQEAVLNLCKDNNIAGNCTVDMGVCAVGPHS